MSIIKYTNANQNVLSIGVIRKTKVGGTEANVKFNVHGPTLPVVLKEALMLHDAVE
jgi:hypothetical protein